MLYQINLTKLKLIIFSYKFGFFQVYLKLIPRLHLTVFDDQERNLTYVKTDFQFLKLKFHASNFKQGLYPFYNYYILGPGQYKITFIQAFLSIPGCWLSNLQV